ncbi:hypothetical protein [Thiomicrorhabdus sp. Milos-T2]|uniref:hypothetical protein n=1 Tax=Thiomicrorhabdus sp. Milos-T2 TaxID=90814 RepID=UPI0004944FED|nr:hypothetical protein [Thiomicrorhabdus sp. Milos-T2]
MAFYSRKSNISVFSSISALGFLVATLSMGFLLTGCEKSAEEKCIDQQSGLWDNKTNNKNANKAYWNAVAKCKEKY